MTGRPGFCFVDAMNEERVEPTAPSEIHAVSLRTSQEGTRNKHSDAGYYSQVSFEVFKG